jgi:hypothetical protein
VTDLVSLNPVGQYRAHGETGFGDFGIDVYRVAADHPNDCATDDDCKNGKNGRCTGGGHALQSCSYDVCMSDTDCKVKEACLCDSHQGNACVSANCRSDADCNGHGCSLTRSESCGSMGGPVGLYCHTSSDECTDDADCKSSEGGGLCVYVSAGGHWACSYAKCVG